MLWGVVVSVVFYLLLGFDWFGVFLVGFGVWGFFFLFSHFCGKATWFKTIKPGCFLLCKRNHLALGVRMNKGKLSVKQN